VDPRREGNVETVEKHEGDKALLEQVHAEGVQFGGRQKLGEREEEGGDDHLAEEQEEHDVAVVDEVAVHTHVGQRGGQRRPLRQQVDVEPVEHFESNQRSQIDI